MGVEVVEVPLGREDPEREASHAGEVTLRLI